MSNLMPHNPHLVGQLLASGGPGLNRGTVTDRWREDGEFILNRYNLSLHRVEESGPDFGPGCFLPEHFQRRFALTSAVTALATGAYGGFGQGRHADKEKLNLAKKMADGVATYSMHECLRECARQFQDNQLLMICIGEGAMPKGDEVGGSPMLGFPRIYGPRNVAREVKGRIDRAVRGEGSWAEFEDYVQRSGIVLWGAATDTLENTTRFAQGEEGALSVMHVFDRPMNIRLPHEGYMGVLSLPVRVARAASLDYLTPRARVLQAIQESYPDILPQNVHVWTLGGTSRARRLEGLWSEWQQLGVHLVEAGWSLPSKLPAFVDSGTYAPMYRVGIFRDRTGERNLFLVDGYAASAEAVQAATLDASLDLRTSLCLFSSNFRFSCGREARLMQLDPESASFTEDLFQVAGQVLPADQTGIYREALRHVRKANLPVNRLTFSADDLFCEGEFRTVAISSAIRSDPYSGMPAVEPLDAGAGLYRVSTRVAGERGLRLVRLTFQFTEPLETARQRFRPLLERLCSGEACKTRATVFSDADQIRDELEMTYYEALESLANGQIKLDLDRIDAQALPRSKRKALLDVLEWYKRTSPHAFRWLDLR